jgi:hypothetical protein
MQQMRFFEAWAIGVVVVAAILALTHRDALAELVLPIVHQVWH